MIDIVVYTNFSKRINSTKIPINGSNISAHLKNGTNRENPTFILKDAPNNINYIKWDDYYYYINDVIYNPGNQLEVICVHDVLASHREDIMNYTCYVDRAESQYDEYINDDIIATSNEEIVRTSSTNIPNYSSQGCYIIRMITESGIKNYVVNESQLDKLCRCMYDKNASWYHFTDYVNEVNFNPIQYITSIKWFPLLPQTLHDARDSELIKFGWYTPTSDLGAYGWIANSSYDVTISLNMPNNMYTDYRQRNDSYSRYTLYIPGVGNININASDINTDYEVYVRYMVDVMSGELTCMITREDGKIISQVNGQIGIDIDLGRFSRESNPILSNLGGLVNPLSTVQTFFNVYKHLNSPTTNTVGKVGGNTSLLKTISQITFQCTNWLSKDIPNTYGRPLCKNVKIGDLHGFCKCTNASIDIDGFGNDKDLINTYLNNGIYIE